MPNGITSKVLRSKGAVGSTMPRRISPRRAQWTRQTANMRRLVPILKIQEAEASERQRKRTAAVMPATSVQVLSVRTVAVNASAAISFPAADMIGVLKLKQTSKIALSAVLSALSVALLALISVIPTLELALPAIAGAFTAVIVIEINKRWALAVWAAVSVLSLLVVPNKEVAVLYTVFFGYYPVLKAMLESKLPRWLEYILKLLTFNVVLFLAYFFMTKLMNVEIEELETFGLWAIPLLLLFASAAFLLYDYALTKLISLYRFKLSKKLRKLLK